MSGRGRVLLGFALALVLLWVAVFSARRLVADHFIRMGERLDTVRHRGEAIAALRRALVWEPVRLAVAKRLGDTLMDEYEDLALTGGDEQRHRGLLGGAVSAYLRAIDSRPADAWSWAGLGAAYAKIALLEQRGRGIALERFMRPDLRRALPAERIALAAFEKAISMEPNNCDYRDQRAELLLRIGLRKEGLEEYRRSARIMPMPGRHVWQDVGVLPTDVADAVRAGFEEALATNSFIPRHDILRNIADLASRRGDWVSAERVLRQALGGIGDRKERLVFVFLLGEAQQRQGKDDDALASYAAAAAEPVVAAPARARRGEILLARNRGEEAFTEIRSAVALRPEDPALRLLLARAARATERYDVAAESLEEAASLRPQDPVPILELVALLRDRGDRFRAAEEARRLVETWPTEPAYRKLLEELEGQGR